MAAAFAALRKARERRERRRLEKLRVGSGSTDSPATAEGSSSNGVPSASTATRTGAQNHQGKEESQAINLPYSHKARWLYQTNFVQFSIAAVILFNFFAIVIEKEIDPYKDPEMQRFRTAWMYIDDVCNIIFLLELLINLYGSFWRPFLQSGWNYLDTVVVIVGVTSLARIDLGDFKRIKVLRAFRIIRLFKRVKSLNQILVALVRSIPGVMNAFIVMLIFMMIFAIVAVDFFREFGWDGGFNTTQTYGEGDATWGFGEGMTWSEAVPFIESEAQITAMTPRGFHYGQEYFGTFSRALYTLFQVLTGESWAEMVVRPLLFGYGDAGKNAVLVGIFFTVYILLTQVVLQNVVVAVLLDKFVEEPEKPDGDSEAGDEATASEAAPATATMSAVTVDMGAADPGVVKKVAAGGGGSSGGGSSVLSTADEAVLVEAASLGARVGAQSSARHGAGLAALRSDIDTLLQEQAMIRSHLHVILSRLPQRPNKDGDGPMSGGASQRGMPQGINLMEA